MIRRKRQILTVTSCAGVLVVPVSRRKGRSASGSLKKQGPDLPALLPTTTSLDTVKSGFKKRNVDKK